MQLVKKGRSTAESQDLEILRSKIEAQESPPTSRIIGDISGLPPRRRTVLEIIEDTRTECVLGIIIMFNMVLIIADTDATADGEDGPVWISVANKCLMAVYIFELACRFVAYHCLFFTDGWNVMDFCIIGSDIVLLLLQAIIGNMPKVTILRVFRLIRIGRAFKALQMFKELALLLQGFTNAIMSILWGTTLVLIVILVWAILAVQLIHPTNTDLTLDRYWEINYCERCPYAFGSVFEAVLTLFQTLVAGDAWGTLSVPIIEKNWLTAPLFLCIQVTVTLAIMNLLVAVVVERGQSHSADLSEIVLERKRMYEEGAIELLSLCEELDSDHSHCISKQELITGFENEHFRSAVEAMGLTQEDMSFLFDALDEDGSGEVSYIEFVDRLLKYRNADVRSLLYEAMKLRVALQQLRARRKRRVELAEAREAELQALINALEQRLSEREAQQIRPQDEAVTACTAFRKLEDAELVMLETCSEAEVAARDICRMASCSYISNKEPIASS